MQADDHNDEEALPSAAHPTAKAFFAALDTHASSSKQSDALKRKTRSLGWRNRYSQETYYPITIRDVSFSVQQVQRGEVEGTYGTGATVWPAAMVLIKYLEKNPHFIAGKRVVDLGSGTAVTSVAAAVLGASHVVCTDGEEAVVQLARDNINHAAAEIHSSSSLPAAKRDHEDFATILNCPVVVEKYWWGMGTPPDDACDTILIADCVLPKLYPIAPLVQAVDELLIDRNDGDNDRVAILSYEHRHYPGYDPRDKFRELAYQRGLKVETVDPDCLDHIYCVDDVEIWHVRRRIEAR